MRHIHVEDGLRLRFPGRDEAFNEGVEIGLLVGHRASGRSEFTLRLASTTLEQARSLAASLSYRVHVVREQDGSVEAMFLTGRRRPKLMPVQKAARKIQPSFFAHIITALLWCIGAESPLMRSLATELPFNTNDR